MSRPTPQHPELLAPCGSLEAFFAAMEHGADAVYCGLKDFSARAKAKNLSLAELERMLGYARAHDKRIYVTLNTLIKELELPQLVATLADLEALRVDGIIVQDPAVWRLAKAHFPGLELHASTQLTIHNRAGVQMLERLGFTRGVLARELTLAEIAEIRRDTTLELEHFVHGALCFCFSGQCYFSSWLGGKSGNRGRCAQPCRRRYRHGQKDGYWFSPNDLSAIEILPELADAGVCSFKIEGRMKSAEYVASVVGAYRGVLDAPATARPQAVQAAKERLRLSFGRPPTKGFLGGTTPNDIIAPATAGATGRFLGTVDANRDNQLTFKCRDKLHVGDRLRIQPKSDQAGQAFTVKELFSSRRSVKQVAAGAVVSVPHTFGNLFRVGDAVYKVSSEQAFTLSEAACRRRLENYRGVTTAFDLMVELADKHLTLRAEAPGAVLQCNYPVECFAAEQRGLDHETLSKVFSAGAESALQLATLSHGFLPAVVIPPSRLKEIRRDFYREFAAVVQRAGQQQRRDHLHSALAALLPARPLASTRKRHLSVAIHDSRDAHILGDELVERLLLPLTPANLRDPGLLRRLANRPQQVLWDIPFILIGPDWERARQAVQALHARGFRHFRLNNLGHFPLFDGLTELRLVSGFRLFSLNSQARLVWKELGCSETTLYIEDDRNNLTEILSRDVGLETLLTVYGSIPLLTSRIPLHKELRPDTPVISDRGEAYRALQRDGLFILRPDVDFSLLGHLDDLGRLGIERLLVDLGHLGPFSPQGKKVLDAVRRGISLSGTTSFNYQQGME